MIHSCSWFIGKSIADDTEVGRQVKPAVVEVFLRVVYREAPMQTGMSAQRTGGTSEPLVELGVTSRQNVELSAQTECSRMLLTITTTHQPATDLSFLLHKHPERFQSFEMSFGQAHVFYPEVSPELTSAALLLDVDPVGMVRGKQREQSFLLGQYVNDRPYVASSFLSVAISQVFGSAMSGRCKDRPDLATTPIPLSARIEVLPVRGGEGLVPRMFEPLGYTVLTERHPLDTQFPEWGESPYFTVTIAGTKTLAELLTHLYVLIPVFDNQKHYYVGEDELEKLLEKGTGWLAAHPEKDQITRRYLRHQSSLYREALARLVDEEAIDDVAEEPLSVGAEDSLEKSVSLNEQRHGTVLAALRGSGASSVLDLGCGEGKLLRDLLADRQFQRIVGLDVSMRSLEFAQRRLKLDRLPDRQAERIKLIHGSLIYRDQRLANFDAAAVVEVIEHLDPPRLAAFERVLFEFARPKTVVVTTPNQEYNVKWETLPAGSFRHPDHRFEWTRHEFQEWAQRVAGQHGYNVRFVPVGPVDEIVGAPTQMGVFQQVT
ncbi:MAG: 3 terminal ribose 2-O-methyltransferase Hen1 [Planctomycetaceae bacterium]|nr:3 terminal ribose 2-O-methyltransferase Hen1 [Planctomycetaceae bacterium]